MSTHQASAAGGLAPTAAFTLRGREIVVGFDGSEPAAAAVRWAACEAARLGSPLLVAYAADAPAVPPWPSSGVGGPPPNLSAVAARIAGRGAELARREQPGLTVRSRGMLGGAAGQLIELSQRAGLVVVGHRDRSALAIAALGSVSFAVMVHARCPAVIVHSGDMVHPEEPPRPVVVGVDSSRAAEAVVDLAAELACQAGAPLRVLSCWQPPAAEPWADAYRGGELHRDLAALEEARAGGCLAKAVAQVEERYPKVTVTGCSLQGAPAEQLVAASANAGLVVVGSRGRGGFAGMMIGSVSHAVLRGSACPVAVVRRGPL